MKRLAIALALLIAFTTACAAPSGVSQAEYNEVVAELDALKASMAEAEPTTEPTPKPTLEPTPEPTPKPTPAPTAAPVRIFVYEDEYVKIEYGGCELTDRGKEQIVFAIENKTGSELTFQANAFAMDGESLGYTSGSDSVAANSKGKIKYTTEEKLPTLTPTRITGTIKVIDFDDTLWDKRSYEVKFVDLAV